MTDIAISIVVGSLIIFCGLMAIAHEMKRYNDNTTLRNNEQQGNSPK